MRNELATSFKQYAASLSWRGWAALGGGSTLVTWHFFIPEASPINPQLILLAGIACLVIAPFFAFHKVRLQRDAAIRRNAPLRQLRVAKSTLRELAAEGDNLRTEALIQRMARPSQAKGGTWLRGKVWTERSAAACEAISGPHAATDFWRCGGDDPDASDIDNLARALEHRVQHLKSKAEKLSEADILPSFSDCLESFDRSN